MLKSVCVYCGSSMGVSETHAEAMRALAREMINENIALVYGGGKVGLMGVLADEMIRHGHHSERSDGQGSRTRRTDTPLYRQGYARTQGHDV